MSALRYLGWLLTLTVVVAVAASIGALIGARQPMSGL